jgi:hypothetical protein
MELKPAVIAVMLLLLATSSIATTTTLLASQQCISACSQGGTLRQGCYGLCETGDTACYNDCYIGCISDFCTGTTGPLSWSGTIVTYLEYLGNVVYYAVLFIVLALKILAWYVTVFLPNILIFLCLGEVVIIAYILSTSTRSTMGDMIMLLISYNYSMFYWVFMSFYALIMLIYLIYIFIKELIKTIPDLLKNIPIIGYLFR